MERFSSKSGTRPKNAHIPSRPSNLERAHCIFLASPVFTAIALSMVGIFHQRRSTRLLPNANACPSHYSYRGNPSAIKINYLKATHGDDVVFVLFLWGYFDVAYLGYEPAEA